MPHYRLHRDPKSSHQQIASRVRQLARGPVLDVGAAQGMLGQLMAGSGLAIDAVEPNAQWAEACKPHYRQVLNGTIEEAAVPDEKYQVIVCADVLEHTPDPVGIIRKLQGVASPDAVYLISLPNVAHLAVRLMLMFGKFPKMERGILDKTHLQFLTRDTATRMLQDGGLSIERVTGTGVPLDELWQRGEGSMLYNAMVSMQHGAVTLLPRLFAMQFVFEAKQAIKSPDA